MPNPLKTGAILMRLPCILPDYFTAWLPEKAWFRSRRLTFPGEQPLLFVHAAGVAREFAVGADHAMARHDDRNGIAAIRVAHGTGARRLADAPGEFGIADRLPERDAQQLLPDSLLKR